MKKAVIIILLTLALLSFLLLFNPLPVADEQEQILLVAAGEAVLEPRSVLLETDDEESTLYVPAIQICEKLGFKARWDEEKGALNIFLGEFAIIFTLENSHVLVNGLEEKWPAPLKMVDGLPYLPLLPVAQVLGLVVTCDGEEKIVEVERADVFDFADKEGTGGKGEAGGPALYVAYPPEAEPFYYYGEALFVFGSTGAYSRAEVKVNGEPAELHDKRSGNFLTMAEISQGEECLITIEAISAEGLTRVQRRVLYPEWWKPMPAEPLAIHGSRLVPAEKQVLGPADTLLVAFQGSPGAQAGFKLGGQEKWFAMTEYTYPGGPAGQGGIYTASLSAAEAGLLSPEQGKELAVTVMLKKNGREVSRVLPGRVIFLSRTPYKIIEVKPADQLKNMAWLYRVNRQQLQLVSSSAGGAGYPTTVVSYLVEKTRYRAFGACGDYYKVKPEGDAEYFIHRSAVNELEAGDLVAPAIFGFELKEDQKMVQVRLKANERFHFALSDAQDGLSLSLYGLKADPYAELPEQAGAVTGLSYLPFTGEGLGKAGFSIETDYLIKGFKTYWQENDLLIELYKPQPQEQENPLRDKVIIVDPGHGGVDTGAPGPGRLDEKEVVLALSLYLKEALEEEGAKVVLTREDDCEVNLYERPPAIERFQPDFFISVHANAHADNAPATKIHGIMVLYNFAHNEKLADIMLKTMADQTALPAFKTWRRNIAVLRHPQVPSLLVEAGYLMHPDDNWYLYHPQGQKDIAGAIKEGIKNCFLAF